MLTFLIFSSFNGCAAFCSNNCSIFNYDQKAKYCYLGTWKPQSQGKKLENNKLNSMFFIINVLTNLSEIKMHYKQLFWLIYRCYLMF